MEPIKSAGLSWTLVIKIFCQVAQLLQHFHGFLIDPCWSVSSTGIMILNIPTKSSYRLVQSILVHLHAQHVIFLVGRGKPQINCEIQCCHLRQHKCANKSHLTPWKAKGCRFKYSQTWAAASPIRTLQHKMDQRTIRASKVVTTRLQRCAKGR